MEQPAWVVRAIELALADGAASIQLVVLNEGDPNPGTKAGRLRSWIRNRHYLAHALYRRLDSWRFKSHNDPLVSTDLSPLVASVPILRVRPRQTKFSDYLDDSDVEAIRAHDLDVALRLGFRILRGGALSIARHGVWSYHHGDSARYRGGPPGFWEVMDGCRTTGVVLQVLSEELDAGVVLRRRWTRTDPFSVRRNQDGLFWCGAPMFAHALRDLASDGATMLDDAHRESARPSAYSAPIYVVPRNAPMAAAGAALAARYAASHLRAWVSREQWFLAYRRTRCHQRDDVVPDCAPTRFQSLTPPSDRYWADPFPVRHEGKVFILFEEFVHRDGKGHIAIMELGERGPVGDPVRVLERESHLSYPFVFAHEGEHYLVPESAATRRVELWRATRFPFEWEMDRELITGLALRDATIAKIAGRWWLFAATDESRAGSSEDLFLYSAPSPVGPWHAHRSNPVVSDVRSARPAGRLFRQGGNWYRPAQDGSDGYGSAIAIQRIVTLDDRHYREETVTRIEARWRPDLAGTHTINAIDGLTVIDVRRRHRRWL